MNKKLLWIAAGFAVIFIGIGTYLALSKANPWSPRSVTNFKQCVQAGNPVMESYPRQCQTRDGRSFVEKIEQKPSPVPSQVTLSGKIACLPKTGQGVQTAECALGFEGKDGQHYGLKNLSKFDARGKFSATGTEVKVSGKFRPERIQGSGGNEYDTAGVIYIDSIKKL